MIRTLGGWVRNGVDSLALALTEPASLVVVVGAVLWVAIARARGATSLRADALRVGLAGWTMAVLALTLYPLSFASADWFRAGMPLPDRVPLLATFDAFAGTGGREMAEAEYQRRRVAIAAEEGIPLEDVILDRTFHGVAVDVVVKDVAGNVLMFVPLGLLVPLGWPWSRRAIPMLALAAGGSLAIELSQMVFGLGSATIDDVVFNTTGAMLGWAATNLAITARRRRAAPGSAGVSDEVVVRAGDA